MGRRGCVRVQVSCSPAGTKAGGRSAPQNASGAGQSQQRDELSLPASLVGEPTEF